ncbi:46 kDa FK506-binding nuclear protein [Diorhabda sublineata]|uniref:46 kDa FK506-binding nuclear protein n=1 Tax=Diorhabda sublineata TaxID=1163346 RepID=UPI0024E0CD1F|nr:46 kDa FK506-binding nuclear protein [Diorhabda sublineata]
MFWGLIMEPHRRYTQVVKKPFHISMASLDLSTSSEEPAQIMCGFQGRNYLLCTLRKPDMLQCPLDLNFEIGDELSLATNGKCHIHLTGYLIETGIDDLEEEEDDDEEVEEEEQVEEKPTKKKSKRNKAESKNGPPSKKVKSDKQKPAKSDEDEDSDIDVNALLSNTFDSDEDDETFNNSDLEEDGEEEAEEEEDEEDEEGENEWEDEAGSSLSESEDETPQQSKANKGKVNGTPQKQEQQKDKKNKKNQQQQQAKPEKNASPKKESPKKVLQNGLIIEDLKEGQGAPVKSGKFVTVYYEGRLKSNNKVFDSTKQGQGFSFRLGGGEVIKGWDQGLLGMKIGGKRRITCPPNMAYGAKGSPPAIPGNSTLVFEVELKKVR